MFFKSLVTRVIILHILLLVIGISVLTLFHLRREQGHLVGSTRQNATLLLATIEKAIFNAMCTGQNDEVQVILQSIGENPQLTALRIFSPDGTKMLADSYPDSFGFQQLGLVDVATGGITRLGHFRHFRGKGYCVDTRCDLHPRWSPDGKTVTVDSIHDGRRGIYMLEL